MSIKLEDQKVKEIGFPNSFSYIVSLQKPTAVTAAVVGHFRNSFDHDLVIARINRLEYLLVTPEGLKPHREIPIFGRIATVNVIRFPGEKLDSLVVLTVKYHLAILGFDDAGVVRTRAFGNVSERVGKQADTGFITCTHGPSGMIVLRLYERQLKVLQWQEGQEIKAHNMKMEDFNISDLVFVEDQDPVIAYLYQDDHGRHLKTCKIDMAEKEIVTLWTQGNIEASPSLLIPLPSPYKGLIIVGKESVSYQKSSRNFMSVAQPFTNASIFTCFGRIDKTGERYLVGDIEGRLFVLLIDSSYNEFGKPTIKSIKIEKLGEISIPRCIVYLDNSVAFVGSQYGDSQVIKLSTQPVDFESNSFISVIDVFPNTGPIRDIDVMNVNGQNQLITASGAFKEGCLKIVRSGIGIEEMATIELNNVKTLFTLRFNSTLDNYMVVSFSDTSHLLLLDKEEMEDSQLPDFDLSQPIIWAGNIYLSENLSRILQITPSFVQLISGDGAFKTRWSSPERISLASVNQTSGQIVVTSASDLFYLRIDSDEIHLVEQLRCRDEIACVDISPFVSGESKYIATGFWREHSVALFSIGAERIQKVSEETTGSDFLPRSILMAMMEGIYYLFTAMGDGSLYYYQINLFDQSLVCQKKLILGTRPISLKKFAHKGMENIFVCSDRPTVIYSSNHKLMFSNVNLRKVTQMCTLNSEFYKDCLVLSDDENLIIGIIDDIQKIHIRSIPLGESVSRIAYQAETNTIGILTYRPLAMSNSERVSISTTGPRANVSGENIEVAVEEPSSSHQNFPTDSEEFENELHSFCILDANTFECLNVYQLNRLELGQSLASIRLGLDPTPYYAVGTAVAHEDELEAKQGRILIFQVTESENEAGRLRLVTDKEVKGAVYSIDHLNCKLLCSVNTTVRLFDWTPERELRLECSSYNFTTALYIRTRGDQILVGDLMRSITLLSYKQIESTLEEVARDFSTQWTTACEIIDSETFLGAENAYNLFCVAKNPDAQTEEDSMRLKEVGMYYLGEMVNVFKRGTLVSTQSGTNRQIAFKNSIFYGTADGGLGVIVQLPPEYYEFCNDLQKRIASKTRNCLRIDHETYRAYLSDKRTELCTGFIDGDLIESLLEMPKSTVSSIIAGIKLPHDENQEINEPVSVEDVLKIVEDLDQSH